jgi:hypothetical protein
MAQTAPPKADKPGSADDPLVKRYAGSLIVMHQRQEFTDMVLPLGKLDLAPQNSTDGPLRATNSKTVEGRLTHILYYVGKDRSPLEVARNYQDELKAQGGRVLYECKEAACGGEPTGNVQRGAPGLVKYLSARTNASESYGSPAYCAVTSTPRHL